MGKGSGGTKRKTKNGYKPMTNDKSSSSVVSNIESLKNIEDRGMYRAITSAISRYHSIMGVRTTNVKLADISNDDMGVQVDYPDGSPEGVYISKKMFKFSKPKEVKKEMEEMYQMGWQTVTNKPVAHAVTHELAHATWSVENPSMNARTAAPEIRQLYKTWKRDRRKTQYGRYAASNVNEFWAEVVTKAVHGSQDKYTEAVRRIVKEYNL